MDFDQTPLGSYLKKNNVLKLKLKINKGIAKRGVSPRLKI
jgi:hypothetical protein